MPLNTTTRSLSPLHSRRPSTVLAVVLANLSLAFNSLASSDMPK